MADSDEQDDSQKTEEPTSKKLEEARKKGQVPLSREVNNWIMLLTGTILIATASSSMFSNLSEHLKLYIAQAHAYPSVPGGLYIVLGESFWRVLSILILPFLVLIAAAFVGPFVQVGPIFSAETLKPDLSKISPAKGFKRLFSKRALMEFVKGLLKIGVIASVGSVILYPYFDKVEHLVGLETLFVLDEMKAMVVRLMTGILVVLLVVAVIDLVYQRNEHYKKMRMTKQEIKDEYKQTEGDPHVRAKLRQLRQEKARQRMMQAVPQADVVITNPTHFSIALKYDPDSMPAPQVIAKGIDETALRIREVAKEHNIELYENKPLARTLYDTVELDEFIPESLYKAVAEVISFIFKKQGKLTS